MLNLEKLWMKKTPKADFCKPLTSPELPRPVFRKTLIKQKVKICQDSALRFLLSEPHLTVSQSLSISRCQSALSFSHCQSLAVASLTLRQSPSVSHSQSLTVGHSLPDDWLNHTLCLLLETHWGGKPVPESLVIEFSVNVPDHSILSLWNSPADPSAWCMLKS